MMAEKQTRIRVPKFANEAQEAQWWFDNRKAVQEQLIGAIEAGTAHRGGPRRVKEERAASKTIAIRMPVADIERARALAGKKGLGYQTYMKMLLHEALEREAGTG